MGKIWNKIKGVMPTKRKWIQLYAALLFNANIKGFFNGRIYQGPLKNVCTPGINCYSCPGASGACPLGSLQNSLYNSDKSMLFYMIGTLMLYGILFGRFICGFLCPFGFIQELLFKIKTPKLKKNRFTRIFSYFKYVLLVFLVIVVPILYAMRNVPLPGFCKYICPAGTLEGAFGLLTNAVNESQLARLGPLFTWKFALLVSFVLGSIFIFRFFCRFFCPLGAIYGFFNRFAVFGIKLERSKCVDCGLCTSKCKMDIKHVGDHECISCGECVEVCPTQAISWRGSKIFLPPNEIEGLTPDTTEAEAAALEAVHKVKVERVKKRNKILKTVLGVLMTALLAVALIYYNFIDVAPTSEVSQVGDLCPDYDIPLFDETGMLDTTFNPAENQGKVTIINFWYTTCTPCVEEMPDFNRIANEYSEDVTVVALHCKPFFSSSAYTFVGEEFAGFDILFGVDERESGAANDYYYSMFENASSAYPMTVILDKNGVIVKKISDAIHYDALKEIVEDTLYN